ncbi:MFS general substrate transporter [Gloeophyllum trabeum ATCC 11539]|uniref:MFS general substrate transporter n=1 Tax=Gloeophyllum trabeum (strain ATCC 11539 / FP-39264 / Madison 617) TaxID=670483 RepID=S7RUT4_GLOTA|nr:MFS general substrate transporter [Gloeophyllum trabeum ATCC 11539]EPQ56969.1 MFS general substrate transporter [Gloeophyllum trabeum ATCC 11539]
MLGFVCFMCPGMFNALNGLGGGGQIDPTTSANSNSTLYATFAVFSFFGGSINNKIGARWTLFIGTMGYALNTGSYLAYNIHPDAGGFVIAAGAICGICAGLLWTAQGSLMLAYPTEMQKGQFIGIFWAIFNMGAVIGDAVSFGQNYHSSAGSVNNGTYIAFLVLNVIGVTIPLFMANPNKMIRSDGTRVTKVRHPSWKTEIIGLWVALRTDPFIILLFPMFFASNWFYTWQFNDYNGALFNIRTRSLNSFVYYLAQIFGSVAIGLLLDRQRLTRRFRAYAGWAILLVFVFVVHIWAYFYQKDYTRADLANGLPLIDFSDSKYPSRIWLYIFCGLLDAMWQTTVYWLMGAMSNDPAKLAYFTGFYKALQSAGAAGIWRGDGVKLPYMNIFISTWVLLVAGLFFALPMIQMRVKEHTDIADETM